MCSQGVEVQVSVVEYREVPKPRQKQRQIDMARVVEQQFQAQSALKLIPNLTQPPPQIACKASNSVQTLSRMRNGVCRGAILRSMVRNTLYHVVESHDHMRVKSARGGTYGSYA